MKFKNFKVLTNDISEENLDAIIDQFNYSLGINCDFYNAKSKTNEDLIFECNARFEKKIARKMMSMTYDIDTNIFWRK